MFYIWMPLKVGACRPCAKKVGNIITLMSKLSARGLTYREVLKETINLSVKINIKARVSY
jgi:hypothetical protein